MNRLLLPALLGGALLLSGCGTLGLGGDSLAAGNAPESTGPRERGLYLDLIAGLQQRDLHRAALAHLDEFDTRFGATADTSMRRAESLAAIGEDARAEATFRARLGRGDDGPAQNGLGMLAGRRGRWAEAVAAFTAALAKQPTSTRYLNNLGYALYRAGQAEEAEFRLRQAEELDPASGEVRNNLILVLMANRRRDEAERRLAQIADTGLRDTVRRRAETLLRGEPA
ncbi:tetratricopeptide repeat protein [Roseomonas sp. 18066]|uniref:tetratricopeptide repeat protein n=1 Tax=Roseomonas sp. 18066 TaxID=2681412 RepID=UPI0013592A55|nr:tetratricopeptide repeat protein [Roseomonas sp. 18066]